MGGMDSYNASAQAWFIYYVILDGDEHKNRVFDSLDEAYMWMNQMLYSKAFKERIELFDNDGKKLQTIYSESYKRYKHLKGIYA